MTIDVANLVSAAGGELVGKVRMQKVVYLLDQLGLNSCFLFEYHHYGPFSDELAEKVEDEVIFGNLVAEQRRRLSDGVPYVVYKVGLDVDRESSISSALQDALQKMQMRSATILELAATIHWLAVVERVLDWRTELARRKGVKAQNGRSEEAEKFLGSLGIPLTV